MDLLDCACYVFEFTALQISQKRRFLYQHEQASSGTSSYGEYRFQFCNEILQLVVSYKLIRLSLSILF